jgi:membrane protease YdiL (CAAX protease family)
MTEPTHETPVTPQPPTTPTIEAGPTGHQPVAHYLHTAIVAAVLIALGVYTAQNTGKFKADAATNTYISTIIMQWILFAFVWLGIKLRGYKLNDVFGKPWGSFEDALMDLVVAIGFWFSWAIVAVIVSFIINHGMPQPNVKDALKGVEGLIPRTANQLGLWILLSFTAGTVEEFIFRGYFQRQFTALTQRVWLGVLIPSLIFLCGHLYQGEKAIVTGLLGLAFGVLAAWRRNLRPGIMAHVWQDVFSGVVGMLLLRHPELLQR